jgi:hypothetical protein
VTSDLIDALGGFGGVTIRVRHELPDASMRLLATLNARVEIDPTAPECFHFGGKHNTEITPGGCARCRAMERAAA